MATIVADAIMCAKRFPGRRISYNLLFGNWHCEKLAIGRSYFGAITGHWCLWTRTAPPDKLNSGGANVET